MHEQELRKHRCCFTGHIPEKLNISEEQLCVRLGQEIDQAIEDGFTTFISGMAKGVDICAAELVLKRRVSDARLKLICALPYENFGLHWSTSWTDRYVEVIRHADLVRCISQEFSYSTYQRRNEWMVDHSGRVIAVYTGESGGTTPESPDSQPSDGETAPVDPGTSDGGTAAPDDGFIIVT